MRRGDIVWVDLGRRLGSEASFRRSAVIVSNEGANDTARRLRQGTLTVVPVTSNTARVYPFQVLLPAERCRLSHDSKAQAEQVCSVNTGRIGAVIGEVPADLMEQLDDALRLHLAL